MNAHALTKPFANRKRAIIIIALLLVTGVLIAWFLFGLTSQPIQATANEYKVLKAEKYSNRVSVSGSVEPRKTATLFTHLTGPVAQLNVKLGDRVVTDQIVAQLDVSTVERELARQTAEQASAEAGNLNQVEQAQTQLDQARQKRDQGLDPELNNAQAALRIAEGNYQDAVAAFEAKQTDKDLGRDPLLRDQAHVVDNAREQVLTNAINTIRAGVGIADVLGGTGSTTGNTPNDTAGGGGETPQAPNPQGSQGAYSLLGGADALHQLHGAVHELEYQEGVYLDNLAKIDQDLAAAQRAVSGAFEGKKEAVTALEAAQLASDHQLSSLEQSVQQAVRAAEAGHVVTEQSANQLRYDIASGEIRAPFDGVVTAVVAQQGQPANGALLAVGDDATLLVEAEVKEIDVPKIKVGTPVVFTTVATGAKKYSGRVAAISPVGEDPEAAAAAEAGAGGAPATKRSGKKPQFPIQIEVTGNREGLLIGGSAKAQIITDELSNVLVVPRDAVITDDNNHTSIFVAADHDGDHIIEQRNVTIRTSNDVDAVLAPGDVKPGDIVLTQPDTFRDHIGQAIDISEEAPPAQQSSTSTTEQEK